MLSTRFIFPIHDAPGDYYRFTEFGLRELFGDGWKIESLNPEANNFVTLAILLQRMAYQMQFKGGAFTAALILLMAKIVARLGWLVKSENGINSREQQHPCNVFVSGYYLTAIKC